MVVRAAFTIAFHAKHHLERMIPPLLPLFDLWVVVEGPSDSGGSTGWCKRIPARYLTPSGHSKDGTCEWLWEAASRYPQLRVVTREGAWKSKDEMVNRAVEVIRTWSGEREIFLWEFDADEYWKEKDILSAEENLVRKGGDTGLFLSDYFVGPDLIARGEWGEGKKLPYRRLWRWRGAPFASHEPPVLEGGNGIEVLLPERFDHLAYFFEEDVRFKDAWYGGHEGIYKRWKKLQKARTFPQPLSSLLKGSWGKTDTTIHKLSSGKELVG